eukprot:2799149-Amphidinium_carterae.1
MLVSTFSSSRFRFRVGQPLCFVKYLPIPTYVIEQSFLILLAFVTYLSRLGEVVPLLSCFVCDFTKLVSSNIKQRPGPSHDLDAKYQEPKKHP